MWLSGRILSYPQSPYASLQLDPAQPKGIYLHGPPVFPAGCDMRDHTGVCLFADIDPIHLDDALSRVKPSCRGHSAFKRKREHCQKSIWIRIVSTHM